MTAEEVVNEGDQSQAQRLRASSTSIEVLLRVYRGSIEGLSRVSGVTRDSHEIPARRVTMAAGPTRV